MQNLRRLRSPPHSHRWRWHSCSNAGRLRRRYGRGVGPGSVVPKPPLTPRSPVAGARYVSIAAARATIGRFFIESSSRSVIASL